MDPEVKAFHAENIKGMERQVKENKREITKLRIEYIMVDGDMYLPRFKEKIRISSTWKDSLSWIDRKIVKSFIKFTYSKATVEFWKEEIEMRRAKERNLPRKVVRERMELRRKENMQQCCQAIEEMTKVPMSNLYVFPLGMDEEDKSIASKFDVGKVDIKIVMKSIKEGRKV